VGHAVVVFTRRGSVDELLPRFATARTFSGQAASRACSVCDIGAGRGIVLSISTDLTSAVHIEHGVLRCWDPSEFSLLLARRLIDPPRQRPDRADHETPSLQRVAVYHGTSSAPTSTGFVR
jgi:hypothetical protein